MRTLIALATSAAFSFCATACLAEESSKTPTVPQSEQKQEDKGKVTESPAQNQTPAAPQPTQPITPGK